ncbi:MAG: sulfate permease [Dysgonamonadaceae bacterium]|jgi:SulP family sulfate permease|nr:sulfate permease [Dysgonamonadaceae bacterium]
MSLFASKVTIDFKPKLFTTFRNYSKEKFLSDLMAGIIVGIVALPLAIAFGIASGVSPEKGLITAIIGGFIVSFLGGSSVQIGGPTGAFIIIVYGIVQQFGLEGLAIATVLAGVMLIGMGLLRLGTVIKFIPYPIIVGFTSGIALTIFTTQIKDLFGLSMTSVPADFISKWTAYGKAFTTTNIWSVIIGISSILIIIYSSRLIKKIPGSLIAIIILTIVVYLLKNFAGITGIETIGDRFQINASLPEPTTIAISFESINLLLPAAFTIAMLGAIESLLSATVADGITGDRHHSNTELIAQGAANIVTPLFGGIPVTGAIARTMTNINNGGRNPIAGIIHAVVLLLILLFLGPLTKHIPMACLAGVLVIVSYNMSEWRTFRSLLKNPKSDVTVLLVTFFLTVIFDLTIAIEIGILLAMVLLVKRVSETSHVSVIKDELNMETDAEKTADNDKLILPKGVEVYEIDGPFFFGIANKFEESMRMANIEKPKIRIIRMRKVPFMDSTGLHNLESLYRVSHKENIQLVLSGVNDKIKAMLDKSGFADKIGKENICSNINEALWRVEEMIKTIYHNPNFSDSSSIR